MEAGVQQTIEPFKAPPKPARRPGALALDAPDVVEEGDARGECRMTPREGIAAQHFK